jgi:hypothetical protein
MCRIPRLVLRPRRAGLRLTFDPSGRRIGRQFIAASVAPAFGPEPQDGQPFAWIGREQDPEVSLQYNQARCYDATPGGWLDDA